MAQAADHRVVHILPHVPVRQWVLALLIPPRLLLASQPARVTPMLQVVHRAIARSVLDQAGLKSEQAHSGAVSLIQRFGSAANLNSHLHCLVLDGVYRCGADGEPVFVELPAPTDEALQAVLHQIITRTMKLLTRKGCPSKSRARLTWPTTTAIRTSPACSGRCRLRRVLVASPLAHAPATPRLTPL